jgi:hypothetical protein
MIDLDIIDQLTGGRRTRSAMVKRHRLTPHKPLIIRDDEPGRSLLSATNAEIEASTGAAMLARMAAIEAPQNQ